MRPARLTAALIGILGCGCGGPGNDSLSEDVPSEPCLGEPTRPLAASDLMRALGRHGFTVFRIPGDAICDAPAAERMPVSVGNVLFEGPHENIERHEEIAEREGHVICGLRRGPIWGWKVEEDLDAPPSSPIFSGDKATFSFANLERTLYPEGQRGVQQVRNLQSAVRDLVTVARRKRS